MKLMTKTLEKEFAKYKTRNLNASHGLTELEPVVVTKYFDPCGSYTIWATGWFPEDGLLYGFVTGSSEDVWGHIRLDYVESIKNSFGLGIERDLNFKPTEISKALKDCYGENAPNAEFKFDKPIIPPEEFDRKPGESRKEHNLRIRRLIIDNWGKAIEHGWKYLGERYHYREPDEEFLEWVRKGMKGGD